MLVDDDSDDRYFFVEAMKSLGEPYSYCFAENGKEALKQLNKMSLKPDFIFLDLNMPVMGGRDCLAELKKDPGLKNIPVIIYSTSVSLTDKNATLSMGADYYMSKPMDINNLSGNIKAALNTIGHKIHL